MNFIGIIPARYASTRFPGKPLVEIKGKSMIQRVYEQACKALEYVVVATDDERIYNHVESFGGKVVMTSDQHRSGTDRCAEAIRKVQPDYPSTPFDVVINIQGDEPFIQPEQLRLLKSCFDEDISIATLAKPIESAEELFNPNVVKVIINRNNRAIYFSRAVIPYQRNEEQQTWLQKYCYLKHIGIYAYRVPVLKEITQLPPSSLECAESLEQNRWIENEYSIYVQHTNMETVAIDTPEDLEKVQLMF
ncbi:MAG: 3-deoxy-manno-octulosonate cytidylyltransferase [Bacteroidales bacterium]|nr:3-deoxy-manno-octulosonate cytidylyltransferase [Bacteroidales bacterium]